MLTQLLISATALKARDVIRIRDVGFVSGNRNHNQQLREQKQAVSVSRSKKNKPNLFVFLISKTLFGKINKKFFCFGKVLFQKVKKLG